MERVYNFSRIEKKWEIRWQESEPLQSGIAPDTPLFSVLSLPGEAGELLNSVLTDIMARRKRMQGYSICLLESGEPEHVDQDGEDEIKRRFMRLYERGSIYLADERWFFKTTELAGFLTRLIKDDNITFVPEQWSDACLTWLETVGDRCISCNGNRGVAIPAYCCHTCGEIAVTECVPGVCVHCDSTGFSPAAGFLTPGFATALAALGKVERFHDSGDRLGFYPLSLVNAEMDTVFTSLMFFLAAGIEQGHRYPCRDVFVNGRVRWKTAKEKDSLEKERDPGAFGKDALRFALASRAVPGKETSISPDRVKTSVPFLKKLWHAARFIVKTIEKADFAADENEKSLPDPEGLTDADKWILHALNNTVEKVNDRLDNYRVHEAAKLVERFFRREFCGWYLEFARGDLKDSGSSRIHTLVTLRFAMGSVLKLLHPFIPFITEEIYRHLYSGEGFLLQEEYPSFKGELAFSREYKEIESLKKVAGETRKVRALNNIAPGHSMPVCLAGESKKEIAALNRNMHYFDIITRSSGTRVLEDFSGIPSGYAGNCLNWRILLPFSDPEELKEEIDRLNGRMKKLDNQIRVLESRLTDDGYRKDAAKRVVAGFKRSLQEKIGRRDKMLKAIHDLTVPPEPLKEKKSKNINTVVKPRKKVSNE